MVKSPPSFVPTRKTQTMNALKIIKNLIASSRNKQDLLADCNETILLCIGLMNIPKIPTLRCVSIPIPHSLFSKEFSSRVFLITKDPQREWRERLDELAIKDLPISKVQSISKLGKNFMRYKDKRHLLTDYDLFLADVRVFNLLPERLGKYFYSKKKIPALLDLETDPESALRQALNSTFLTGCRGPNFSIKIGRASMSPLELYENARAVIESLPNVLPGLDPAHVRRLEIKGTDTLSLPIYNFLAPEEVLAYNNLSNK